MNVSKNIIIFIIIYDYGLIIMNKFRQRNYIKNMSKYIIGHCSNFNLTRDYILNLTVLIISTWKYNKYTLYNYKILPKSYIF